MNFKLKAQRLQRKIVIWFLGVYICTWIDLFTVLTRLLTFAIIHPAWDLDYRIWILKKFDPKSYEQYVKKIKKSTAK